MCVACYFSQHFLVFQGCISVGGIQEVFHLSDQGDRLHFYKYAISALLVAESIEVF